jgi:hypothetical protein
MLSEQLRDFGRHRLRCVYIAESFQPVRTIKQGEGDFGLMKTAAFAA